MSELLFSQDLWEKILKANTKAKVSILANKLTIEGREWQTIMRNDGQRQGRVFLQEELKQLLNIREPE